MTNAEKKRCERLTEEVERSFENSDIVKNFVRGLITECEAMRELARLPY